MPGPKQVLRQELWLWGPNPRQGSEPVELLLEIFIDKVKFVVILKCIQLLLGEEEKERGRGERKILVRKRTNVNQCLFVELNSLCIPGWP